VAGQTALDESEAKSLLRIYGVRVPHGTVAEDEDEARDTAELIGFPVVMKAVAPDFQHKTEAGLVVLSVQDDSAVRRTFSLLKARAGRSFQGVLVEKMVKAEREFMVGMKRDAAFGPAVAFGVGGVWTEAFADIAVAIAPLSDLDAAELMELIRAKKMLGAFRGYPAVDRDRLTDVLQAVGQIALDHPAISEIDINPLLTEKGLPVAADALVILGTGQDGPGSPAEVASERDPADLRPVFAPRAIAIVGASADPAKWGGSLLKNTLEGGYTGEIYPINPRGGEIFGLPVYQSLDEVPLTPDLALVAVAAPQVAGVLAQCGRLGIPAAVVVAAGFSEAGKEGAALEEKMARAADEAGMVLVGPNCMGVISNECRLHATGFVAAHPRSGGLSVISQSGNVGYKMLKLADRRGAGISKFVSVGNEARINSVDVVEYLGTDPHTDAILMYLEGVKDGRRLMDIARRTTPHKPIVVVRGGLTAFGSHAAASHTGAMAGTAAVREASARQTGAMGTTSPDEGLDLALSLTHLPLPRGRRVAVVTLGGGWGVIAADEVARNGLVLADLPPELLAELDEILPPFWSHGNPIDMVTSGDAESIRWVLERVTRSDAVDAVLVLGVVGSPAASRDSVAKGLPPNAEGLYAWDAAFVRLIASLIAACDKPVINVPLEPLDRSVFSGEGCYCPIVLATPKAAAQVLSQMAWYKAYLQSRAALDDSESEDRLVGPAHVE
jgi:acyl-CoA synthetase (NDP forming)